MDSSGSVVYSAFLILVHVFLAVNLLEQPSNGEVDGGDGVQQETSSGMVNRPTKSNLLSGQITELLS